MTAERQERIEVHNDVAIILGTVIVPIMMIRVMSHYTITIAIIIIIRVEILTIIIICQVPN